MGNDLLDTRPDLLGNVDQRRKRELLRARLFGSQPEPLRLGRFVLLERLGVGGMGIVYAAYDEQLDRKVALKVLLSPGGDGQTDARARMLREAQALAKISHPNVVIIHEAGLHQGDLFLAMELVDGETMRVWQGKNRTLEEILAVYRQAAGGLQAAHAHGLTHRDFKPENVMVDRRGRVRVLDFGLVHSVPAPPAVGHRSNDPWTSGGSPGQEDPTPRTAADASAWKGLASAVCTADGVLMGTPAYMPPEQLEGRPVDARTDQFAFCVALFEALYGARPFVGGSLESLADAIRAGRLVEPPEGSRVPPSVRRAILRGLRPDAADRWPSMAALLAALSAHDVTRARRQRAFGLGLALLAASAAGAWSLHDRAEVCAGGREGIAEAWGPSPRAALRDAIAPRDDEHGAIRWRLVETAIDRYTTELASQHRAACLAHRRGEESAELLDLRTQCLTQRRRELEALITTLSRPTSAEVAAQAPHAVELLTPTEECADAVRLRARGAPPPGSLAEQVDVLRARLAAAAGRRFVGEYPSARAELDAVVAEARVLAYEPLLAESLLRRGECEAAQGSPDLASSTLEEAFQTATRSASDALAAEAATALMQIATLPQSFQHAPSFWEKVAQPLAERAGRAGLLESQFLAQRGLRRVERREADAAEADFLRARQIEAGIYGPTHPAEAAHLAQLSLVALVRGRTAEHEQLMQRALGLFEERLGPEHPRVAAVLESMTRTLLKQERAREALPLARRALEVREKIFGRAHPFALGAGVLLARALWAVGNDDEATASATRSVEGCAGVLTLSAGQRSALTELASVSLERKQGAVAQRANEVLLAATEAKDGASSVAAGMVLHNLGIAFVLQERYADAGFAFTRASAAFDASLGERSPLRAAPRKELGKLALRRGDVAAAITWFEQALDCFAARSVDERRAELQVLLAKVVLGRDRRLAHELATTAAESYRQLGRTHAGDYEDVRRWLTMHFTIAERLRLERSSIVP